MTDQSPTKQAAKVPETLDPAYYEALGRAIKVARTELGMSRKELAAAARISYPYVADIESGRGRPSSSALLAIARALGMSPSTLMASAEFFADRMQEEPTPAAAEAAPRSPARSHNRWFHDARAQGRWGRRTSLPWSSRSHRSKTARAELHRVIDELPGEDVPLALELARRLLSE